jgi:hypothetical protein
VYSLGVSCLPASLPLFSAAAKLGAVEAEVQDKVSSSQCLPLVGESICGHPLPAREFDAADAKLGAVESVVQDKTTSATATFVWHGCVHALVEASCLSGRWMLLLQS